MGESEHQVPEFRLDVRVEGADVDEQGHVSNIVYVRWIQDVAVAHSTALGYAHADYVGLGSFFVVRKHEVEYLRPAYAGEEVALLTHIARWRAASCERKTRIERVSDGALLCRATTLWAFIDIATGKPMRIPGEMKEGFGFAGVNARR
ncbi:MAG: acyl-CoA thioesterase [Myxococcales bacterium]|nr:acyl-CoA thioesterase [Myxococcales bacterium]